MNRSAILLVVLSIFAMVMTTQTSHGAYSVLITTDGGDTEPTGERIYSYSSGGALQDTFDDPFTNSALRWFDVLIGSDNLAYAVSLQFDSVYRYDPSDGSYVNNFLSGSPVNSPSYATFGPDGNLYVGSESDGVRRYQGPTGVTPGAYINQFIGASHTRGLEFGPDGNFYVGFFGASGSIAKYDNTGAVIDGSFITGLTSFTGALHFHGGDIYVAQTSASLDTISRYDGTTGAFVEHFVTNASGGLNGPGDFVWTPDGYLLVTSSITNQVLRYDGTTGDFVDVFATFSVDQFPRGLAILIPEPSALSLLGVGLLACGRRAMRRSK